MALKKQIRKEQLANDTARRVLAYSSLGVPELIQQFSSVDGFLQLLQSLNPKARFRIFQGFKLANLTNISYVATPNPFFTEDDTTELVLAFWVTKATDSSQASGAFSVALFRKDGAAPAVRVGNTTNVFLQDDIAGGNATFDITTDANTLVFDWDSGQAIVEHDVQVWFIGVRMG